jgi:hypothetical protein
VRFVRQAHTAAINEDAGVRTFQEFSVRVPGSPISREAIVEDDVQAGASHLVVGVDTWLLAYGMLPLSARPNRASGYKSSAG